MTAGFDWKPLLSEREVVVWEGRPSRLKIFAFGAVLTAVSTAGWLFALGEVAQAPGGAECLSDDCPTADRKAGLVVHFAGPVSIFLGVSFLLLSAFIRQVSAVTSKSVLTISFKLWRRQPTLKQVPVKGARTMLNDAHLVTLGLLVSSPHANQRILLWAKSRRELKRAKTMIEQLSSDEPPAQGHAP